jgi:hypothetical protein
MSDPLSGVGREPGEHYVDPSVGEEGATEPPISNFGVKLSPNEHSQFYDDVPGMSQARPREEKPKEARPLPPSVRRCCEHPEDDSGRL